MNLSPETWSAIFAGLTVIFTLIIASIVYGMLRQMVTDHDKRITVLESDGKSQQAVLASLSRDIAVLNAGFTGFQQLSTSQLADVKHDVKSIEISITALTKMAWEDRAKSSD